MATYLVTGVAGFIASRVAELLLAEGHTVVGVDNLNDYYDVRLKHYRLARLARQAGVPEAEVVRCGLWVVGPKGSLPATSNRQPITLKSDRFEFHTIDIEDIEALDRLFLGRDFGAVFNLAARAGVRYSLVNPHVYLSTNTQGTLNLLECMRRHGVKKQVLASTSSLYAGCTMPFSEDQPVNTPLSPYAASKKAAEMMAYSYHRLYEMDITVLRYFTVFGPAGRPDMAPYRFVHWVATGHPITLFGDGTQARDFTYVDDIARGTIQAAKPIGFEVINLGGGNRPISINRMIGHLEEQLGRKAVIDRQAVNPVDMTETQADIAKAERLLGWKPQVSPEEGFRRTVDWYLENREWLKDLNL